MGKYDYWRELKNIWNETPTTGFPSILFIVDRENPCLAGFSYVVADAVDPDGTLELSVIKIQIFESGGKDKVVDVDLRVNLKNATCLLDDEEMEGSEGLDEESVFEMIGEMLDKGDFSGVDELISEAEHPSLLPLYHAVRDYIVAEVA